MKINLFFLIKITYCYFIFLLMRSLKNHITDKHATELVEYWEVVYQQRIRRILKHKSKKMFGDE